MEAAHPRQLQQRGLRGPFDFGVEDVDDLAVADLFAPAHRGERSGERGFQDRIRLRADPGKGHQMLRIVDQPVHRGRQASDQPVRSLRDRLEYRLHVGRRRGDHLQDVGRGRLPLQRFLGLVEQPCILHRDHGLGGEVLKQRDLLLGKGTDVPSGCGDLADQTTLLAQRNEQHGSDTTEFKGSTDYRIVDLSAVRDLGEAPALQQLLAWVVRAREEALTEPIGERLGYPVRRDRTELIAVIKLQAPVADPAKAVCPFQDRLEYGCEVARR
jgi:hypothetical protein